MTIVGTGWTVDRALGAAERLAAEGIEAEVIDPRTLAPLDTQTILESVEKTGHLVLVDQATRHASVATVIAGEVAEHGFSSLKAPIVQVTALDATIPYSEPLEAYVLPDEDKVVAAVQQGARDGVRRRSGDADELDGGRPAPARDDVADPPLRGAGRPAQARGRGRTG